MKKIVAVILLLAFSAQTFSQGYYYLSYVINRAEYVRNCVNKARPQLKCNGKCLLMRRIEEQEKKQQQQAPEMKLAAKSEVLSSKNWYTSFTPLCFKQSVNYHLVYNIGSPVDQSYFIFHPPA